MEVWFLLGTVVKSANLRTRCLCETRASSIISVGRTGISVVAFPFGAVVGGVGQGSSDKPLHLLKVQSPSLEGV